MMRVRILRADHERLHAHLFQNGIEQHAFLLAQRFGQRLIVREMMLADPAFDVIRQSPVYISLKSHYVIAALEKALAKGLHVIDVHSHPFTEGGVAFSSTDFRSAAQRFQWHRERAPQMISVGLVFGRSSVDGRVQLPDSSTPELLSNYEVAGRHQDVWPATSVQPNHAPPAAEQYSRQILAFGGDGQRSIASVHVGIVGLGGTGSALVTQLAHLGVKRWTLVDADRVEATNLNRLVGASVADIGRPKVEVAASLIRGLVPDAEISDIRGMLPDSQTMDALGSTDLLFGCGDNAGVRVVLTRLAVEQCLPYIDLGTGLSVEEGRIAHAGGQVFSSWPGEACLSCYRRFDGHAAAAALRSQTERESHAGIYGTESPQPSVVTLNSAISSIAAGEFLKYATWWRAPATLTLVDAGSNRTDTVSVKRDPNCPICSLVPDRVAATEDVLSIPIAT